MQHDSADASRVVNRQQPDALARRAPCVFRPEAHAAAERNQVADGRRPGALVGILRHESTLLAKLAALLPETAVAHHADELLPAQVVQAQGGLRCERGGLRHGEQNPLMKPVVAVHPVRIHQQVIRWMRRVADAGEQCHCKMHIRVRLAEANGGVRHQIRRSKHTHMQCSRLLIRHLPHHFRNVRKLIQRLLQFVRQPLTVGRERNAAPLARNQRHTQFALQPLHRFRQRGLRNVQRFGGARHVLHLRNGQEVRQLGQFHQSFLQNMNAIAIIYFTSWLVKRKMSDGLRTERRHSS